MKGPPVRAVWRDRVLAESDATVVVEGNHYFPPDAVDRSLLVPSDTRTVCGWKGTASYYHVVVGDERNEDAAWFYPDPEDAARRIRDHVSFWRGVEVVEG